MAVTPSTMLELGTAAPSFSLTNAVDGRLVKLEDFAECRALLVMFICNHCPFVVHVRSAFGAMARDYAGKGLGIVAINANSDATHPQDGPEAMKRLAMQEGWTFPFLFDAKQEVAKAYRAACTPDFFLFDEKRALAYRGQLDGARPGNGVPVSGEDLRASIDAILAGEPLRGVQAPSVGCNIKWAPGNAPEYAR